MGTRSKDRLYDHGSQLRQLREMAGLTSAQAAEVTSISWQTLCDVERDKLGIKIADVEALIKLYKSKGVRNEAKQQNNLSDEERRKLFEEYKNYAYWHVNRYRRANEYVSREDLEQIALMSLWKAVCFYDFDASEREFSPYAGKIIKGELVDAIYKERQAAKGVSVPVTTLLKAYKVWGLKQDGLSFEKISAELGLGLNNVKKLNDIAEMKFAESVANTDDDNGEFEGDNTPAVYDDYRDMYNSEIEEAIHNALDKLPDEERNVVEQVHGFGGGETYSIKELSKKLNMSYGKTFKLYHRGLALLRQPRNSKALAGFL